MARMEIRIPDWLKNRAEKAYPNISKRIRELLIVDLKSQPISQIPKISTTNTPTPPF